MLIYAKSHAAEILSGGLNIFKYEVHMQMTLRTFISAVGNDISQCSIEKQL